MMRQCFVYLYAQTLYDTTLLCPTPHYTVLHYTTPHSILHRPRERLPVAAKSWCLPDPTRAAFVGALHERGQAHGMGVSDAGSAGHARQNPGGRITGLG